MSPPPVVWGRISTVPPSRQAEPPRGRDSSTPSAFARRSGTLIPTSSSAAERSAASRSRAERTPEATVIVVRERPKAGWVMSAALIGAVCALGATRLLGSAASPTESAPTTLAAPAAPPAAPAAAPVVVAPAPPPALSAAVIRFGDDQGVAIKALPRFAAPPAAAPAPQVASSPGSPGSPGSPVTARPVAPVMARPVAPVMARPVAPVMAPVMAPSDSAKKRPLTPEQQLAEAQLKASMR